MSDAARLRQLARAVARQDNIANLLPELHQQAIRASGGRCSVLLNLNSRTGQLRPSCAVGLDDLDGHQWMAHPTSRAAAERTWTEGVPLVFTDLPELGSRLGASAAMLVPLLSREARLGLLAVGVDDIPTADAARDEIAALGDLVSVVLDRARLRRDADLRNGVREILADLSHAVTSPLDLGACLEAFCDRVSRLFCATRTSVWLHDREAKVLELVASSDAAKMRTPFVIASDDVSIPVAVAMRARQAYVSPSTTPELITMLVPLKGRRRAMGTLALEGVRTDGHDEQALVDRLTEVARHTSSAIENVWLLEDVLRYRNELQTLCTSLADQSRLEADRAELTFRLAQSEKLAALGQFVAGIAHELNNPLQGVLGHVELMIHGAPYVPERFKRDLKMVFREADRAAKIVHNLLVFAGSRRITRRRLNASLVMSRVLSMRSEACGNAAIEIVKDFDPKLPRVIGDGLLLQQALLNIILNAEHALANSAGPRRITATTRRGPAGYVQLQVADNGCGIPPEALGRLFEPFFTTKEVGKGTGLGLAIAYGIVQEHGGRLLAANHPDGGAVFTLELPSGAEAVE